MGDRHRVFVSYFHKEDQQYKNRFEYLYGHLYDIIVSGSVEFGDIDPNTQSAYTRQIIRERYIRNSSVTVVLIGPHTWQRKHVDWEIHTTLRDTESNPRGGLLGLLLPNRADYADDKEVDWCTIPPILYDNLLKYQNNESYANLYYWSEKPESIKNWIQVAYGKRERVLPNLKRKMYGRNHTGSNWCH